MLKKIGLSIALVVGTAVPALAQSATCTEPVPDGGLKNIASVDGATVATADLVADIAAFKKFQADSDTYQGCLQSNYDDAVKTAAAKKTSIDPTAAPALAEGKANQELKVKLGESLNTVIIAYQKAHPKK